MFSIGFSKLLVINNKIKGVPIWYAQFILTLTWKKKLKLINIKWELKEEDVEDFDSKEDAISFLNKLPSEEIIDSGLCDEIIEDDFGMDYDAPNFYTDLEKTLVEEFEYEYSPAKIISYELVGLKEHVEKEKNFLIEVANDLEQIALKNGEIL